MEQSIKIDDNGDVRLLVHDRWRLASKRECTYCGTSFWYPVHWQNKPKTGTFCSRKCFGLHQRKRIDKQRIVKHCVICDIPFRIGRSRAKRINTCRRSYCVTENRRRVTKQRHIDTGQRVFQRVN